MACFRLPCRNPKAAPHQLRHLQYHYLCDLETKYNHKQALAGAVVVLKGAGSPIYQPVWPRPALPDVA